tara:strand:+ start:1792 stop:2052 length:261 start_codon:yes stop_codon:yes gene_type:complete
MIYNSTRLVSHTWSLCPNRSLTCDSIRIDIPSRNVLPNLLIIPNEKDKAQLIATTKARIPDKLDTIKKDEMENIIIESNTNQGIRT